MSFDPAVGLRDTFGPLLRSRGRGDPSRENLFQLLQNRVPALFCGGVLRDTFKLALQRAQAVVDPSDEVRHLIIIDTDRSRPSVQRVADGSARLVQRIGSRLRGSTGAVLRAVPSAPELAERLVRHDQ